MENYDFFNYLMKGGNLEDFKKRDNEDNSGEINITTIDQDNVTGSLYDFLGNFPFPSDIKQLKDMSGCYP